MNNINAEKVKEEAKEIMDNFMNALCDIEVEEEFNLKRDTSYRDEKTPSKSDEDFRQRFLNNAPKISGSAVLANKGEWTKSSNN